MRLIIALIVADISLFRRCFPLLSDAAFRQKNELNQVLG
jgi:hypothetical protein